MNRDGETHRLTRTSPLARHGSAPALLAALLALAVIAATGCAPATQESPATESTPQQNAAGQQQLNITFQSRPDPPRTGENTFEVTVTAPDGAPVTDAEVSVGFYMAAMPSMNMPEMRNSVPLAHEGNGVYRGTGSVMMAGAWEVTVSVSRQGQHVASRRFNVTAQ